MKQMLFSFLAYVIATLTSYTVQFMSCLHCLLDKTIWNQQFGWLGTTPKFKGVYLQSAEGKCGVPITWYLFVTITKQLILTLVQIVCFVAIQTRTMAKRMGMNWSSCSNNQLPVDAVNVLEACDKRDDKWSSCIHSSVEYIQDFYAKFCV